jgi:hypothetical protein
MIEDTRKEKGKNDRKISVGQFHNRKNTTR